jgi:hypothetical protein
MAATVIDFAGVFILGRRTISVASADAARTNPLSSGTTRRHSATTAAKRIFDMEGSRTVREACP